MGLGLQGPIYEGCGLSMGWEDAVLMKMPCFMEIRWATEGKRGFFLFGAPVGIRSHLFLCGAEEGQSTLLRAAGSRNRRSSRSVSVAEPIS